MTRLRSKKALPLSRVYRLLEPGPVVLLTTAHKGRANVMTMSWHTMMEFEPPLVGCIVSNRNYSFEALRRTKECVINIPTAELARKLVAECYAGLECKVVDARLAEKYNFFILRVVKAWIDPSVKRPRTLHHRGMGEFMIAGRTLRLPSRMK